MRRAIGKKLKNEVVSEEEEVLCLDEGHVKSLSFYPLGIMLGLITSESGQRGVFFARCNEDADYIHDFAENLDFGTLEVANKFIEAIQRMFQLERCGAEQICCAVFRKMKKWDVFFYGQRLYTFVRGEDDECVLMQKDFGSAVWTIAQSPLYSS